MAYRAAVWAVAGSSSREVAREVKKPRNVAAFAVFGACVAGAAWHQAGFWVLCPRINVPYIFHPTDLHPWRSAGFKALSGELSSSTVWKANARSWTASCPHCRKSVPDWRTVYRNLGLQATKARSECDPGLHHTFSVPVACCVVKSEAFPRA